MNNVYTLDQIETTTDERFSTGIISLDFILGEGEGLFECGAVEGSVIVLAGAAGCGKSRLSLQVASNINRRGEKVLVFEGEASLSQLKKWMSNNVRNPNMFFVSDEMNHKKQIEIIKKTKPSFVVVDSVNVYDVNYNQVKSLILDLQDCAQKNNCIFWLIGQLDTNSREPKIRGSQDWTFIPDVVLFMSKNITNKKELIKQRKNEIILENVHMGKKLAPGCESILEDEVQKEIEYEIKSRGNEVKVWIPNKNRHGPTGKVRYFKHTNKGLIEIDKNGRSL